MFCHHNIPLTHFFSRLVVHSLPKCTHKIINAGRKQCFSYSKGFRRFEITVRLFYLGLQMVAAQKPLLGPSHNLAHR